MQRQESVINVLGFSFLKIRDTFEEMKSNITHILNWLYEFDGV